VSLRTVKLVVEYDGTGLAGWQRQDNAVTVQQRLEEALEEQLSEPIKTVAAGRTDAGVHAEGQVASFRTASTMPLDGIHHGTNTRLPEAVAIRDAEEVAEDFHARKSALGKIYRYRILQRRCRSPLAERFCWRIAAPLDERRMVEAASHLVGRHDFSSFRNTGSVETGPVRTLRRLDIRREEDYLAMEFEADGFLYRMVRNLVGTLVQAGHGRVEPEEVGEILAARDRTLAGPAAPARGLCLVEVLYGNED
jgi:tRNA pseudouridine38-40 synthase